MRKHKQGVLAGTILLISITFCAYYFRRLPGEAGYNQSMMRLNPPQYVKWTENNSNGIREKKSLDDYHFAVQFIPGAYMYSKQVILNEKLGIKEDVSENDYQGIKYFNYKIAKSNGIGEVIRNGVNSVQEYQERIDYYAFRFKEDIMIVQGDDSIACSMTHFERAYNSTPVCNVLIGFPADRIDDSKECTIIVHERVFNKGLLKFRFEANSFNKVPKLTML